MANPYGGANLHDDGPAAVDARKAILGDVIGVGERMTYTCDFGDNWEHDILVEKALEVEMGLALPRCLGGRRRCPPEDVGGVWGCEELLEALDDPRHPEHEEHLDWVGPKFDPTAFDAEATSRRLRRLAQRRNLRS